MSFPSTFLACVQDTPVDLGRRSTPENHCVSRTKTHIPLVTHWRPGWNQVAAVNEPSHPNITPRIYRESRGMIRAVPIRILRQVPVDLPKMAKSVQRQRTARLIPVRAGEVRSTATLETLVRPLLRYSLFSLRTKSVVFMNSELPRRSAQSRAELIPAKQLSVRSRLPPDSP